MNRVLLIAELRSNNRLSNCGKRLARADFKRIVLSFAAGKWLAGNGAVEIERNKIAFLYDIAVLRPAQGGHGFLATDQCLIDLLFGDGDLDLFDFDTKIIFEFDGRLDLKHRGKGKLSVFLDFTGLHFRPRDDLQAPFFDDLRPDILPPDATALRL